MPESPRMQSLKGHQPAIRPRASRRNWDASRAVDDAVVEAVAVVEFILEPESSEAASSLVTDDDTDPGDLLECSEWRPCPTAEFAKWACRLEKVLPSSGRCVNKWIGVFCHNSYIKYLWPLFVR